MKIVLDTNVLVSGIFWAGTPGKILSLWAKDKFQVLATDVILDEYLRTLEAVAIRVDRMDLYQYWLRRLPSKVKLVSKRKLFHLCRDPKDDMFIDCAIGGKARYIVSGDKDLLDLKQVMSVRVIDAKQLLRECHR